MRAIVLAVFMGVLSGGTTWADDLPDLRSKSAVVIDAETGEVIWGKSADTVRPIASTTKIFVAMAVRKAGINLDGWTTITKSDARFAAGGSRTRLEVGKAFRNRDLLRAMLISSDNRAPTALGRAAGMSPEKLIEAMNRVAKKLKLKKTKFVDPSGLRGNSSTAREMAIALRAALEDDVIQSIMGESEADVASKDGRTRIHYGSTNQILTAGRYRVRGGKTGFTTPAGYCFITDARVADREVVMAFLGADGKQSRFGDFYRVAAWLERGAPGAKRTDEATASARSAPLKKRVASGGDESNQRPKRSSRPSRR